MDRLEYILKILKAQKLYWIYILLFTIFFMPYFILGENSKIAVHDNLDSNVAWVKMIIDNDQIFSSPNSLVPQPLNGLPRSSVYGIYDFSIIIFSFFGMFWGYVVNKIFISILAFFGMFFLLKNHFFKEKYNQIIVFGVACIYSFLPFWSFNASVAGLPLLLNAFLNIRSGKKNILNYLVFILFPFYSSLILSGIFILSIILLISLYDLWKGRKEKLLEFFSIFLISIFYIISHWPLFYNFIFNDTISHRMEFVIRELNFIGSSFQALKIFFSGQEHAIALQEPIAILAVLYAAFLLFKKKESLFLGIFFFLVLSSIFYGFYYWSSLSPVFNLLREIIPIQFNRFYFVHPMLWYILFALILIFIANKFNKRISYFILIIQFTYVLSNHEIWKNRNGPSFSEFYAVERFQKLKSKIDAPVNSYRVVSVGIHPAVLQYNGFYTLDGYFPDYPLSYKHKFRNIMKVELDKNPDLKNYFDDWGSRCYLYSSELGKLGNINVYNTYKIENFEININALRHLGGRYLISIAKIENNQMELLEKMTSQGSYPEIYLYRLN